MKPKLKLTGESGNAFYILGRAHRAAKQAKWSTEKWSEFEREAMSGDYNHLLQTVMLYFDVS